VGRKENGEAKLKRNTKEGISKVTSSLPLCGSTPPYQGGENLNI
jgi:hypothetical protein